MVASFLFWASDREPKGRYLNLGILGELFMARRSVKMLALCLGAGGLMIAAAGGANAKIRCDGRWQINSGERISTPYCEDAYLARVAQSYGSHVSAEALRQSPTTKRSICNFVGADIRVQDICSGWRDERPLR
jgi:hypothetical protein